MIYRMFFLNLRPLNKLLTKKKNMNTYETVFIMNPVLSDSQVKETVQKFTKYIKEKKGVITNEESWGLKKLKYPIQNKKTGFYYLIEFQSKGDIINDFEIELKRDERIIRWQTIRLDKFALEYAERRKNKINDKSKEK